MSEFSIVSELVPEPKTGRVFSTGVRVGLGDTTPTGRARLDAIARWLQEVAHSDFEDGGFAESERGAWVLRRAAIKVIRFPLFGERLSARTWCSGIGRLAAERRTTAASADGDPEIEAVAIWIRVDPVSGLPARISDDFAGVYRPSAGDRGAKGRLRHPEPSPDAGRAGWRFRATDLDLIGHVNNACYWEPLEEELITSSAPDPESLAAEIEFREPALAGDAVVLSDRAMRWITAPTGELHASIAVAREM